MRNIIQKLRAMFITDRAETAEQLKWLWELSKGFRKYIWGFLFLSTLSMVISLGSSVVSKYTVDAATGFADGVFYKYMIMMAATTVLSILIRIASTVFNSYVGEKYTFSVMSKIFDAVQRAKWYHTMQFHSGDIIVRITDDVQTVASGIITILPNLIVSGVQLLIVLMILLKYEPMLAVIGLIIGPLGFISSFLMRREYSEYDRQLRETKSEYQSFFQDIFSDLTITKAFQLEKENGKRFEAIKGKRLRIVLQASRLKAIMVSVTNLIYSGGYLMCFGYCSYLLSQNTYYEGEGAFVSGIFTYGTMTLFLNLVNRVEGTIETIGSAIPRLYSMIVSAKRIREISESGEEDYRSMETIPQKIGIRMQDVSFGYSSDTPVLRQVSLEIASQRVVGLIGRSGRGKTTLVRLLLALISPDSGSIEYVDENGNTEPASPACRSLIAFVPQGNTLLSGTIRTNLAVGNVLADEDAMWNALRIADAEGFIKKLPDGLDTVLTENAGGLSEGQAQRISIARAILGDKPLLILDEATSALDEETESRICENIAKEIKKTCIIITHRSSMLKYCDSVMKIDENGGISIENTGNTGKEAL